MKLDSLRVLTNRLRRIGRLIVRHHVLLMESWIALLIIRAALWTTSQKRISSWIAKFEPRNEARVPLEVSAWAVERLAPLVPSASCLTQALALKYLAQRDGIACTIRIGVKQGVGNTFEAHAWVVAKDKVLLGGKQESLKDFSPLADL